MNYSKYPKETLVSLLNYSENACLEMIKFAEASMEKSSNEKERQYHAGRLKAYRHALRIVRGDD